MSETVKDCNYPWTWMMVLANGSVKPCCFCRGDLGNLHTASADAIWNGAEAIELRAFIKADKVHPMCENAPCRYVQNMKAQKLQRKESSQKARATL